MATRFSVLLPTHNRADVVGFAIRSVLAQTEPDFEILVAGDGCTDNTAEVVASFGDDRIRWFDLPKAPGFGYANRNVALREARGQLVALLAHDDLMLPDHLELMSQSFSSARVEWAYSRPFWMTDAGIGVPFAVDLRHPVAYEGFMQNMNPLPASCVVHRRSCFDRYGYWPEEALGWGDWLLWKRIIGPSGGTNLAYVSVPSCIHFRANWRPTGDWVMPALTPWMERARTGWWPADLAIRVPAGVAPQRAVWEKLASDPRGWVRRMRSAVDTIVDSFAWDSARHMDRSAALDAELVHMTEYVRALEAALGSQVELRDSQERTLATQAQALAEQTALSTSILTSRSWRVTAPARWARRTLRIGTRSRDERPSSR